MTPEDLKQFGFERDSENKELLIKEIPDGFQIVDMSDPYFLTWEKWNHYEKLIDTKTFTSFQSLVSFLKKNQKV